MTTTTTASNWLAFGPITDPYRQAVYAEIQRLRDAGHLIDDLDVQEWPGWTTPLATVCEFVQPFRVYAARSSPSLDPDREQEPLPMEGE